MHDGTKRQKADEKGPRVQLSSGFRLGPVCTVGGGAWLKIAVLDILDILTITTELPVN